MPHSLCALRVTVKQVEFGPSHVAVLLDDGRVARLPFTVLNDRLDLTKPDNKP